MKISWTIDFDDQDGDLEDYSLEQYKTADEVMAALKREGGSVHSALAEWCMLDHGTVTITVIPDLPPEVGEPRISTPESRAWEREHATTAVWAD